MSIILEASGGASVALNAWNWGVLHHLVAVAGLFPAEVWEPKRYNGGGELDASQVTLLAEFLAEQVLPNMSAGQRMLFDGTVTSVPDDGTFYREESELWKNYGLRHDVVQNLIAFLQSAHGSVAFY